jgi:hypothetical protein
VESELMNEQLEEAAAIENDALADNADIDND